MTKMLLGIFLSQPCFKPERHMRPGHPNRNPSKVNKGGLPWWSRGQDSMLPAQGAQAQPLIRRLSPTIKKWSSQIDKMTKSHL